MKKNDQDDDLKYFQQAMKDVKPLVIKNKNIKAIFKKSPRVREIISIDVETDLEDITIKNITSDEKLFFVHSGGGLQHNLLQKLKQGKIKITRSLDLHGMVVDKARQAVSHFIEQSRIQHHRYILIIHGKGKSSQDTPVLKNHVNHWLMQIPSVLAFCSAVPKDGGTGAVYVVLKKLPL